MQRHLFKDEPGRICRLKYSLPIQWTHPLQWDAGTVRRHYYPALAACSADQVSVLSNERMSGHPHSGGFDSKEIAGRLKAVFPGARILMVIREQHAAILSSYMQYVKKGGMCSIKGYMNPRNDPHVPLFDRDHFRYDALIAHYRTLFGKERVKVLAYERFPEDPEGFVKEIAAFAGFAPREKYPFGWKSNPMTSTVKTAIKAKLNLFIRRDTVNACSPFATMLGAALLLPPLELIGRLTPAPLDNALKRKWARYVEDQTAGYYADSNRHTEELTGLDLKSLGYQ